MKKFVEECINSVLNQSFQDFEIVITDDGSADKTVEKIKQFKDSRIKLFVHEKNKGACVAANNCIKNSSGEFIAMLSSDDVWVSDKLEKQVKFLDENPDIAAVFSQAQIVNENGKIFTDTSHACFHVFNKKISLKKNGFTDFSFAAIVCAIPVCLLEKTFTMKLACITNVWQIYLILKCGLDYV
ncbi:MAG: glycosyltransferase family 2 protein [Ignavibacteriales bacterium]|nr:glycosyltransferase family 2 protein [Ignavibacteriales bacterium]